MAAGSLIYVGKSRLRRQKRQRRENNRPKANKNASKRGSLGSNPGSSGSSSPSSSTLSLLSFDGCIDGEHLDDYGMDTAIVIPNERHYCKFCDHDSPSQLSIGISVRCDAQCKNAYDHALVPLLLVDSIMNQHDILPTPNTKSLQHDLEMAIVYAMQPESEEDRIDLEDDEDPDFDLSEDAAFLQPSHEDLNKDDVTPDHCGDVEEHDVTQDHRGHVEGHDANQDSCEAKQEHEEDDDDEDEDVVVYDRSMHVRDGTKYEKLMTGEPTMKRTAAKVKKAIRKHVCCTIM